MGSVDGFFDNFEKLYSEYFIGAIVKISIFIGGLLAVTLSVLLAEALFVYWLYWFCFMCLAYIAKIVYDFRNISKELKQWIRNPQ